MANITVSDLRPAGSDLFADSESFMQELTEQEIRKLLGGGSWFACSVSLFHCRCS
jgi:hypothetical protein